jgi:cytochrome c-type protein NapC
MRTKAVTAWVAALVVGLPVLAAASWMVVETALQRTSGAAFCGACHTMDPFVASYRQDVHGGNGVHGVRAKCTDCHLSHEDLVSYLWTKTRFGAHDVWAQLTYDLDAIDWKGKRSHRESFVFDSGCLKCHADLERASMANTKAFVAHKPYFLGEIQSKCVSCHENVGHRDIVAFIDRAKDRARDPGDPR